MTVCLINISFIDRLLSQGRAVFFCLGIMLSTHIAKTIKVAHSEITAIRSVMVSIISSPLSVRFLYERDGSM